MSTAPFDVAGVAPTRWTTQWWWREAPSIGLPPADTHLVILAAHPDDETLGVGGLLHAASGRSERITVIIASDGAGSHPGSPTHSPIELARIRAGEVGAAVSILAPEAELRLLALPDGGLGDVVPTIAAALEEVLGTDTDTWLLSTWLEDGHPDHAACALAAREVAARRRRTRLYEYPIWFWHIGDADRPPAEFVDAVRRFPLTALDQGVRDRAIGVFASQVEPLSTAPGDEAVLPPAVLAHFARDREILLDVLPRPAADSVYFDELYEQVADPWDLAGSWYERRKRAVLLASLPRERFRRCFEPGSARGDLSLDLVERVDELWCAESSGRAAAAARERLAGRAGVTIEQLQIPAQWPAGRFDLIVLSEVAYYVRRLSDLVDRVDQSLDDDGVLVLVHWRRAAPDHPHSAETVHATIRATSGLSMLVHHEEDDFLLDVLARDPRSVAQRMGLR